MNSHWLHASLAAMLVLATTPLFAQDAAPQPPGPPLQGGRPQPPVGPGQAQPGRGKNEGRPPIARQFIEHLRQTDPQKFRELMQLRKTDPQAFGKELRQLVQAWMKSNRPPRPISREEQVCRELSERYHQTDDEQQKEALRQDLAEAVEQAFEARVKTTEKRIERMEQELQKFKERLELLKKNRRRICEDRLEELTRPPELDWDGDW
jgi:uncharacterized protein YdiU (UPF0061 family)